MLALNTSNVRIGYVHGGHVGLPKEVHPLLERGCMNLQIERVAPSREAH